MMIKTRCAAAQCVAYEMAHRTVFSSMVEVVDGPDTGTPYALTQDNEIGEQSY